jgi:hypothetical protein
MWRWRSRPAKSKAQSSLDESDDRSKAWNFLKNKNSGSLRKKQRLAEEQYREQVRKELLKPVAASGAFRGLLAGSEMLPDEPEHDPILPRVKPLNSPSSAL